MFLHLGDERLHVVTHEEKLVHMILLGRVNSNLRWRQSENQPSVANIHIRELEYITQKPAVGFCLGGVNDRMCTGDHDI